MSGANVLDCQGLAGSPALGAVTAGFDLMGVKTLAGFGVQNLLHNRWALPGEWRVEAEGRGEWTPERDVHFMFGCPPCSGFSLMNQSKGNNRRGMDAAINDCMRKFGAYAGVVRGPDGRLGPLVAAFESVQAAGKDGNLLMRELWHKLCRDTGQRYTLHHVFMSGATVGAAQLRKRYFWVVARVPFGIESPVVGRVTTYGDALSDLAPLPLDWGPQPYVSEPTWWSAPKRNPEGTVSQHNAPHSAHVGRMQHLIPYWLPGEYMKDAANRWVEERRGVPPGWDGTVLEKVMTTNYSGPYRVDPDDMGHVITGNGGFDFVHWERDGILTVRETGRLMGFPDRWDWSGANSWKVAYAWQGKQVPVESTTWLAGWVMRSLDGSLPDPWPGHGSGQVEGEYWYDFTHDYRAVYHPRFGPGRYEVPREVREEMDRRPV